MIVGNVELLAKAETGGFYESLVKGTNPAADKAGADAGRIFGAAFVKSAPPLASALVKNGEAFVATAESQGRASGEAFSTAYIAGLERAGVATAAVFRDPAVAAGAETEGSTAGRAFATGVEGQLPLFGEEGLTAGRAFSRSFIEGTSSVTEAAAAQGTEAGRAFVSGDLEQLRLGQTEIVAAIREQGSAVVAQSEVQGAEAGAAFSQGQRRGMAAGSVENSLVPTWGKIGQGAEAAGLGAGARFSGAMNKGVALGVVAAVAGTAYMAGQFQQKTNILVTAAGEDANALGMVRKGILDIATSTGTKWQDLTDGMYQIEKAGYRGADGLRILRAAAQAAREEGANLATVTNATTSVMMSYHLGVDQAVGVTNAIKTAAGESKTTMEAFAGSLSTVLPIASANHIAFADVAGALATLTQHGTSADEATQELSNTIRNLAVPNAVASKEMAQLGINSNEVSQMLGTKGLTGTLDFLSQTVLQKMGPAGLLLLNTFNQSKIAAGDAQTEFNALSPAAQKLAQGFKDGTVSSAAYRKEARALGGEQGVLAMQFFSTYSNAQGFQNAIKQGGPAAQTYSAAIRAMTGGANGLNTTLQITGDNLAGTEERTKRVADAMKAGGQNVQGWDSTQKLFNVQMDIAKQKLSAAAISVGNFFLPALTALAKVIGPVATGVGMLADKAGKILGPAFRDLGKQLSDFGRIVKPAFDVFRDSPLFKPAMLVLIGALVAPFLLLTATVKLLSLAFRDVINPVARFVAVLVRDVPGALGAVGRFFQRMWSDVSTFTFRMWHDVATFFSRMWKDVSGFAARMYHDVTTFASRMWHDTTGFVSRMWHDVTTFFARMWHDVVGGAGAAVDFISRHWRLLIVIFTGPIGFVIDLVNHFWQQISGFFARMWRDVSGFAVRMWRDVTGWFARMWHDAATFAVRIYNDVTMPLRRMGRFIDDTMAAAWRSATSWFARMWHDVANFASNMWHDVSNFVQRMWRDVAGFFSRMWRDVTATTSSLWHVVAGLFLNLWHDVTDFTSRIWRDVTGYFDRTRDHTVNTANDLWHKVMIPFRALWDGLRVGFDTVVAGIKTAWDKLENIFKVPINFFIDPVYNKGVVPVWNFVMDVVGEPTGKLHTINKLDAGGGLSGPARGDDRLAMVGGGEHMWTADEVKAAGGHHRVAAMRSAVLGRPVRVMGDGSGSYFLGGGVLHDLTHNPVTDAAGSALHAITHNPVTDAIGGIVKDLAHMVRGAAADIAAPALNGAVSLLEHLIGTSSGKWGHEVGQMGHTEVNKMIDWIRGADAKDQAAMAATLGGQPISWDGGSNTIGLIEKLALGLPFGNVMQVTSTNTGGHASGSYHYMNEAVDFSNGTDTPQELAFAQAWASKYGGSLAELFHTPLGFSVKDGARVPWLVSGHDNHVHVAISPASIARGHQNFQPFSSGGGNIAPGPLRDMVQQGLNQHGWGSQFPAVDYIISHESSWNPLAQNSRSTAHGLFQMLTERSNDPATQIRDGLNYIGGRYGDPNGAQRFWASHGWYDDGGYLMPGTNGMPGATVAINNTGRRERVLDADETEAYEAGQRIAGAPRPMTVKQVNNIYGVDQPTAERLAARRLGLALTGAGVTG